MPLIYCNGTCIRQDFDNCGKCGGRCNPSIEGCVTKTTFVAQCEECSKRGPSWRACNARCANVDNDFQNCGACGHVCFNEPQCRAGSRGCFCKAGRCVASGQ